MTIRAQMEAALNAALRPETLTIVDESAAHAGHAGAQPGGETHFRVIVTAAAFAGLSRLERHRLVNTALAPLLRTRIHALAIEARVADPG